MEKLIGFKVSEQDFKFIKKFADENGLNLSKFIRNLVMNDIQNKQLKK